MLTYDPTVACDHHTIFYDEFWTGKHLLLVLQIGVYGYIGISTETQVVFIL